MAPWNNPGENKLKVKVGKKYASMDSVLWKIEILKI
jgi:hypothetical protein